MAILARMCGRYMLSTPTQKIVDGFQVREWFENEAGPSGSFARYNIAPTQMVPVVRVSSDTSMWRVDMLRWGLIPSWAKDRSIGNRMINARSETVDSKLSFKSAFNKRRCLLPATGFYEWRKMGKGKQPHLIKLLNDEVFAFAGLWETWHSPADNEVVESCTILTTSPNEMMAELHNRMPVIVDSNGYEQWLDPEQSVDEMLSPYPVELMICHPVSTRVNSPKNDDPKCIEPLSVAD